MQLTRVCTGRSFLFRRTMAKLIYRTKLLTEKTRLRVENVFVTGERQHLIKSNPMEARKCQAGRHLEKAPIPHRPESKKLKLSLSPLFRL